RGVPVGFLTLSNSLPSCFRDNHVRVLKILGGLVAHLSFLHQSGRIAAAIDKQATRPDVFSEMPDSCAVILMEFDEPDGYNRRTAVQKGAVRQIRESIRRVLLENESVMFYREKELLVLMPGVDEDALAARVRELRESFKAWQKERHQERGAIRLKLGFSICDGDEELSRMLEVSTMVMRPDEEAG
ncbi:MAG TPA: hypothetical protein VLL97_01175, partial [Acidobacteriota bacterium]|nr:hypothetical protein [Acidobacteriota bacterium]